MKEILTEISSDRLVLQIGGKLIAPSVWKYEAPLFRADDAETSKVAAANCEKFRAKHEALIYDALHFFGERGGTAKEIATKIQMTDVQVNRRLGSMGERKLIEPTGQVRAGCRSWRVTK